MFYEREQRIDQNYISCFSKLAHFGPKNDALSGRVLIKVCKMKAKELGQNDITVFLLKLFFCLGQVGHTCYKNNVPQLWIYTKDMFTIFVQWNRSRGTRIFIIMIFLKNVSFGHGIIIHFGPEDDMSSFTPWKRAKGTWKLY